MQVEASGPILENSKYRTLDKLNLRRETFDIGTSDTLSGVLFYIPIGI